MLSLPTIKTKIYDNSMNGNIFTQEKVTHKINFNTYYKTIKLIEADYTLEELTMSFYEIGPTYSIESFPNDLWCAEVFVEGNSKLEQALKLLNDFAKTHNCIFDFTTEKIEDKDWVSEVQKNLAPIEIDRFFISSQAKIAECPNDKTPIIIDAGRAFGVGSHQTTKGCIKAMLDIAPKQHLHNILDMGSGTGILSIIASHIWPQAKVQGYDIDEIATGVASANALINQVSNCSFITNSGYEGLNNKEQFDLVISNILAQPLINFASDLKDVTIPGSFIILSGFLLNQEDKVIQAHQNNSFSLIKKYAIEDWSIIVMQKQNS